MWLHSHIVSLHKGIEEGDAKAKEDKEEATKEDQDSGDEGLNGQRKKRRAAKR